MTSARVRYTEVVHDGITATVQITRHAPERYRVDVDLGRDASIAVLHLNQPAPGTTVIAAAEKIATAALRDAITQATQPHLYVRVDGLPGYAHDTVAHPGMVEVGYWMDFERGVPVTVYRVIDADDATIARFVADVEGRDFTQGPNATFGPATVTLTRDVLAATDNGRGSHDGVTRIAADRAIAGV